MNNYFAKLAARATVSSGPAPIATDAKTIVDPFEETALPVTRSAEVPSEKALSILPEQDVRSSHSPLPSPLPHRQENSTLFRTGEPKEPREQPPRTKSDSEWVSRVQRRPPEAISKTPIDPAREPEPGKEAWSAQIAISPGQPVPIPLLPPMPAGKVSSAKKIEGNESSDQFEQERHEESMRLRKADDFMRKVFKDCSPVQPAASDKNREVEQPPVPKPNGQIGETGRLHPRQRDERMFERDSDGPSLVIGRLTVEVTSPPPAQAAPQQPFVVVHRARGAQGGISSSRRFGLSQL